MIPTAADLIEQYGKPDDFTTDPPSNNDKAGWALVAFAAYCPLVNSVPVVTGGREPVLGNVQDDWSGTDFESTIGDLIADLLILGARQGLDASDLHDRGWRDFAAEIGKGFP